MDEYEVVREVQVPHIVNGNLAYALMYLKEHFADYAPLLPALFSLNHLPTMAKPLYGPTPNSWDSDALERTIRGITAVLLSLKKKPVIRYEKMSGMAKKLAVEIQVRTVICIVENCNTEVRLIAPNTVRVDSI